MHFSRKLVAVAMVIVLALALFAVIGIPGWAPRGTSAVVRAPDAARELALPFSSNSRYFDPALMDATGRVDVIVAMESSAPTAEVARFLRAARAVPSIGDVRLVRGTIDASQMSELQSSPYVLAVLKDRPIQFDAPKKPLINSAVSSRMPGVRDLRLPEPTTVEREPLMGRPEISMRDVVNFTGARRAWTELGVDGTGVTIAVVDTGVDHGAFNLGDSAIARNAAGVPISFDPDGSTFAWTTISVTNYTAGAKNNVTTNGTDPLIYIWDYFGVFGGGPVALNFSDLFGIPFFSDMEITGLPASASGTYRFGILREFGFFYFDLYPVLLIDTTVAGVYDRAYIDMDFDWWLIGGAPAPDFSFSNEAALVPAGGNVIAARDMDGDGYVDTSAGSMAYALDVWGLDPTPPDQFMILKPLDPNGDYITMMYDWNSHGTFVAASAAGRESNHPLAGPGTGPGAKIMGVSIFAWFDIIEGWLWAAGFDLVGTTTTFAFVPNYGGVYGEWTYTGNHKADIISNSWGASDWLSFPFFNGWPWYDVLTVVEDALMTPGYADPGYKGTVMVHAGGNGASGYGTMTEPGFNSLAITVGASTNLNYTSLPFGGFQYDVISWSARGPNAYGVPKPDVLQVGAFAWAAGPIWYGFGSGFFAYDVFGGTSQATPVTAGSAAVLIEAYEMGRGVRPSPFTVKSILKSTALDIGYDAFVQGAGHVDVYDAAAYALGNAGILTTTPATWDNLRPRVASPWAAASVFYGEQIGLNSPEGPINDTSWFAGMVKPGGSTSAAFTITPASGTVSGTISAVWHSRMVASATYTGTTAVIPNGPGWIEGFGALQVLPQVNIPAAADLMVVRGIMPYNFLDTDGDYIWDNRSRIIVGDWVDTGDSITQPGEVQVFNYGYNTGTTVEARVGLPSGRFAGDALLWFSQVPAPGRLFVPMTWTIQVEFYDRLPWSWITAPAVFSASAAAPAQWTASMTVPAGTSPGVYEGQIIVTPTGGKATAVPVSVVVPATIDAATLSTTVTSSGSMQIYDPSSVNGYFDWSWRYEAGDWKLWFVDVTDPTTIALRADVSWTGARTDVDIWSLRPDSIPSDSSFSPDLGDGAFLWSTRTETTADWVVASTVGGLGLTNPGVYTFVLHNVLLDTVGTVPEAITGTVSAAKLSPRSPVTVVTQPGKVVSVPLTLSTGFDLSGVFAFPFSPPTSSFLATVYPSFTPLLAASGSLTTWVNITVPEGTADGMYQNFLSLSGSPGVFTIATVNVVVDSTNPAVSILAPGSGAHVKGTVTLQAAFADANGAATVSFTAGAASGAMTKDPVTGLWTATWATTGTTDGAATVAVTATDAAGNVAVVTRSVVVDNTAPVAVITSPADGAFLSGSAVIGFVATDANLDAATLAIDTASFIVSGASRTIDTTGIADGTYAMTLTVTDMAGNQASDSASVTIDNTAPTVSISVPSASANFRVAATITWSASDANLDKVSLTIDGETRDVSGTTSFAWDTTTIADGSHTIEVQAVDKAGNARTATVTVTTDNKAAAAAAAQVAGLTYGILIAAVAAVVALFVGWYLGRRRKPEGKAPESVPQPEPLTEEEL